MSSGSWLNTDKLFLQFGTTKATNDLSGEYRTPGDRREIEFTINLGDIVSSTAGTPNILNPSLFFPQNVLIEEVQVLMQSSQASVNSTLNFGLINASDRSTVVSSVALVSAITNSCMGGGAVGTLTVLRVGSASAGNLIGSTTTVPANLSSYWSTASQAGTVRLRVFYTAVATISS